MNKSEKLIQQEIHLALASRPDVRLFRNNVGLGWVGSVERQTAQEITLSNYRPVKFGLHAGSGDLIGWKNVRITQDMVGEDLAVFLSVEVKDIHGRLKVDQQNWFDQVNNCGGIGVVARSAEQALNEIRAYDE